MDLVKVVDNEYEQQHIRGLMEETLWSQFLLRRHESQSYGSIKTPFDSAKVYVFDNDSVEILALDPGYVRSLQQEGGVIIFLKGVCEFAYRNSKKVLKQEEPEF